MTERFSLWVKSNKINSGIGSYNLFLFLKDSHILLKPIAIISAALSLPRLIIFTLVFTILIPLDWIRHFIHSMFEKGYEFLEMLSKKTADNMIVVLIGPFILAVLGIYLLGLSIMPNEDMDI